MTYSSIIAPKVAEGWVSHQTNLGVNSYDLDELYSPDTAFQRSKVLDAVSPKYSPNKTYIFDRSAYRNHGTITGAVWTRLPSGLWVLTYDGNDYVNCGAGASLNILGAMSVITWFKLSAVGAMQGLVTKGYSAAAPYRTYQFRVKDTNVLNLATGDGSNQVDGGTTLQVNTWYCGGFLKTDATHATIYLNGVADSVSTVIDAPADKAADNLILGAIYTGAAYGSYLNGLQILTRVTNFALTNIMSYYQRERHLFGV